MLAENNYGKSGIRLVKIFRGPDRHEVRDLTLAVRFEGNFQAAHSAGDNSQVLPTDTMKNTVYALAADHPMDSIESFGLDLSAHFARENSNVSQVTIDISELGWDRISVKDQPHPNAFLRSGEEKATTRVVRDRSSAQIESGLSHLRVLKSAGSAFSGFRRDRYTTLRETRDRIFATAVTAVWKYASSDLPFAGLRKSIRRALLVSFADHPSESVQATLHEMWAAVLATHREVVSIRLSLPNKHHLPVDLAPFGLENRNEIFVATEEPYGLIEATLKRSP